MVHWHPPGSGMGTVDLREFKDDTVVLHFGGALTSVDAYTFANALVAFADMATSVNRVIHPGENIEIRLIADGTGSYRAKIRKIKKGLGGIFSRAPETILWGVVAAYIYEKSLADPKPVITVNTSEVIIESKGDRIIVPRTVYDHLPNVEKDPEVQNNLSRTFSAIESDEAITDFGITGSIDDPTPAIQIHRPDFERLAIPPPPNPEEDGKPKPKKERALLLILKAWLNHSKRPWSFEWNGVPLSAPVRDQNFLDRIDRNEIRFGHGDVLDADLEFKQVFLEDVGVYMTDPKSFVVTKVHKPILRRGTQGSLDVKK
jgi:hypothetical protein